jgi:hypothetical protein
MQVTVITPIAKHHEKQFVRCADSVRKQTIECRHLHMIDSDGKGPAYIRNKLLEQVRTKFVVFLDADDYLEPTFVYECIKASTPERYVFTDWYEGEVVKSTPKGAFWDTAWHLVTCLIHTDMMKIVGGFNEKLAAMEDTEIFLKFDQYAYCGTQIKEALVHYTNDGKRSRDARNAGLIPAIKADFTRRFHVGCCSSDNNPNGARPAVGKRLEGDVEVVALWQGNMVTGGAASGRRYPRASRPMKLWIDPRDAAMRPDLYRILPQPTVVDPPKAARRRVKKPRTFADMLYAAGVLDYAPGTSNVLPVADGEIAPNYTKLNDIAQRICNVNSKSKQSVNGNSKAAIIVTGKADPVRPRSPIRKGDTSRENVAVRNG